MAIALAAVCSGCLGDNYEQPNASLYGQAIDVQTGEPILQDIGGDGSRIEIIEQGFATQSSRYLNFKTDGSFCEKNLFSGQYVIKANRTNFHALEEQVININGDTEFNISTIPYCRIYVESIEFVEDKQKVYATFSVECTTNNELKEIALFCDESPHVSNSINNDGDRNCKVEIGRKITGKEKFVIKMPLATLEDDRDYYFRIGAHTSASEAKWNYAEAVKLHITKKELPKKELGIRWDLFDRFELWDMHKTLAALSWDDKDFKSGTGSVLVTSKDQGGPGYTQFMTPGENSGGIRPQFDASSIPFEGAHMLLTMYCSDANHFPKDANGQIEISSAGIYDQEEICWTFAQFDLRDGWQTLDLSLPEGNRMGDIRMKKIDWFRFYHLKETGPTTLKFDEIRFYYQTLVDDCDESKGWSGKGGITVDEGDCQQGEGSIATQSAGDMLTFEKKYSKPYYAPAKKDNGYLQLWIYVSDASAFNSAQGQIEITSAGTYDQEELAWPLPKVNNGWTKVVLKLSDGISRGGEVNLKAVNYFRIWAKLPDGGASVQAKIDAIRFYQEGYAPEDEE